MGDRVLSSLSYDDALAYVTFLARRLIDLFSEIKPARDHRWIRFAVHGSLALAVARQMSIPWFALHFSVIPPGLACFCNRISPAARVHLTARPGCGAHSIRGSIVAEIRGEEHSGAGLHCATAVVPSGQDSAGAGAIVGRGAHDADVADTAVPCSLRKGRGSYSVSAAVARLRRASSARKASSKVNMRGGASNVSLCALRAALSTGIID